MTMMTTTIHNIGERIALNAQETGAMWSVCNCRIGLGGG